MAELLRMENISKRFGSFYANKNVTFDVQEGEVHTLLGENGVPFGLIFTKADKLSAAQRKHSIARYEAALSEQWEELPPRFVSSSEKQIGRDEILDFIEKCLETEAQTTE